MYYAYLCKNDREPNGDKSHSITTRNIECCKLELHNLYKNFVKSINKIVLSAKIVFYISDRILEIIQKVIRDAIYTIGTKAVERARIIEIMLKK